VICSELASNPVIRVTEATETIAGEVIKYHSLRGSVGIEHYPPEATNGQAETFELVAFCSYEAREVLRGGSRRYKIGKFSWRPLDQDHRCADRAAGMTVFAESAKGFLQMKLTDRPMVPHRVVVPGS